jgi:prepilin-type N-terminal cleavage/methylation domain-containing protein
MRIHRTQGYTLIELIIAVGLFALVMTLAAGAYLMMISISRQTQGITSGIDNVSFAIEMMTRTIRTSTNYGCPVPAANGGNDCTGGYTFSVKNPAGDTITYSVTIVGNNGEITQSTNNGTPVPLTDASVNVQSLLFYTTGIKPLSAGDSKQSRVTIWISGNVVSGPGKTVPFTVETGATMRGTDL